MARSYSQDIRRKVIERIESTGNITQTAQSFSLSYSAVFRWWKRYKETGHYASYHGTKPGHCAKIQELDKFRAYVDANADKTQKQMAADWDCGEMVINRTLKRIGYTYKKRPSPTKSGMTPSAPRLSKS